MNAQPLSALGSGTTAQAQQTKTKKDDGSLDDESIKNMIRYCKIDEKNCDALRTYIKNRGIQEGTFYF